VTIQHVNAIGDRLSLRPPQRGSLEILSRACEIASLAKDDAAATWCNHATAHAEENNDKPWQYLLIPHDQIQDQMTLGGLAARCAYGNNRN